MIWKWESGACPTLTKKDAKFVKVEIMEQSLANWFPASGPSAALDNLDWTTGAISASDFPWSVPDLNKVSSAEPGVAGNSSISMEAINIFAGKDGVDVASGDLVVGNWYVNNGYTKVTYNSVDYTTGQRFICVSGILTYTTVGTGQVERYYHIYDILTQYIAFNYALWIRISTKSTSGGAYVVQYVGIVDQTSVEKEVYNISDPETWMVKVNADDALQLLKRIPAANWMGAGEGMTAPTAQYGGLLRADFDYTATYTYLTFISTLTWAGDTFYPGRYVMETAWLAKPSEENSWWELPVFNTTTARYIKIVDIFTQISLFLGFEAAVNNGGNWSDFHSWQFYYNTNDSTSTGGETMVGVGIDSLWVPSGFYVNPQYYESYTFFDPYETGPHSWKRCGDPLEVLDRICASFGMTYRTRVNSSGQRYLEVIEIAKFQSTKTVTDLSTVIKYLEKPNTNTCDGVEIVSTGSATGSKDVAGNKKKGGGGTSTLKYDNFFLSTNHLMLNYEFRRVALANSDFSGARYCSVKPLDTDYLCSLFVLTGGSGKATAAAYSICVIQPKDNGAGASGAYPSMPEYGEFRTGGIAFPKATTGDPHYSTYIETPAMALAHYLYGEVPFATDPVGFVRPKGDGLELSIVGIDYDASEYPPIKLTITAAGKTKNYVITEIKQSIADDVTTYIGHTRDV